MPREAGFGPVCAYCGRSFKRDLTRFKRDMKRSGQVFCDRSCSAKHRERGKRVIFHCANCGIVFSRPKAFTRDKRLKRAYCGRECFYEGQRGRKKGKRLTAEEKAQRDKEQERWADLHTRLLLERDLGIDGGEKW